MRIKLKCCIIRCKLESDPALDDAATVPSPGGGVAGCSPRCTVSLQSAKSARCTAAASSLTPYCTALCCTTLHCTVLHCTALH